MWDQAAAVRDVAIESAVKPASDLPRGTVSLADWKFGIGSVCDDYLSPAYVSGNDGFRMGYAMPLWPWLAVLDALFSAVAWNESRAKR